MTTLSTAVVAQITRRARGLMPHPHRLHAQAAAWSLHTARARLIEQATAEAAQIAAEQLEAPALLHSPAWGRRHALGGHSDPTPGLVVAGGRWRPRRNRWAEMEHRLDGRLCWIVGQLPGPIHTSDPIAVILDRIPGLLPGTARTVAAHLADEDTWVRDATGQPRPTRHLVDVDCPVCAERALYVQTAGPETAWTVVCTGSWRDGRHNPCLCTGEGCPCGMPGAVEGVAHIWPRAAVLAAVAGLDASRSPAGNGSSASQADHTAHARPASVRTSRQGPLDVAGRAAARSPGGRVDGRRDGSSMLQRYETIVRWSGSMGWSVLLA